MYQVDTSANAKVLLDSTTSATTTSPTSSSSSTGSSTTGSSTTTILSSTTSPSSTTSSSTTSTTLPTTSTNSSPTSTLTSSTTSSSASTTQSSTSTSSTPTTTPSSSTTTSSSSTSTTSPSSSTTTTSKTSTTPTTSPTTYSPTPGSLFSTHSYLGCANETTPRALSSASYTSPTNMTLASCLTFCASPTNNYALAGLENGNECHCGNGLQNYASPTHTGCTKPCSGNKTQICGGASRLSVWNATGYVPPTTVRQVGTYLSQGCYPEVANGRLLTGKSYVNATGMTVESCVNFCAATTGAVYAGLEYGQECYCGASIPSTITAQSTDLGRCNKLCSGNNREFCGGASVLNVYKDTPGSVGGDGMARTVNVVNEAVIRPNVTTVAAKSKKRDILGEGMERLRLRLRWERRR
ncbi:MAG: hypothetical protein Q9208_000231 [Pyrenodesmia sp. 3 TL-2023]